MVSKQVNHDKVKKMIYPFLFDSKVYKELGESLFWEDGDIYFFKLDNKTVLGFCCFAVKGKVARLKYFYVAEKFRARGYFTELYNAFESEAKRMDLDKITATSTNKGLECYLQRDFEITKSWTNYHNIQKNIK